MKEEWNDGTRDMSNTDSKIYEIVIVFTIVLKRDKPTSSSITKNKVVSILNVLYGNFISSHMKPFQE